MATFDRIVSVAHYGVIVQALCGVADSFVPKAAGVPLGEWSAKWGER